MTDRVEPEAGGPADLIALQLFAGLSGLLLRLGPGPVQLDDLGPVHAANAGKAGHRLPLAPARRGLRPLARAAVIREIATGPDGAAVHPPGGEDAELPRDGRDRRRVEARQTCCDVAVRDEREALGHRAERLEVTIGEALPEVGGAAGERDGRFEAHVGVCDGDAHEEQVPELGTVFVAFEELRRTLQPSPGRGVGELVGVVLPEPERDHRGAASVPGRDIRGVRALPRGQRLGWLGQPPRGVGQHLESLGVEAVRRIGLPEQRQSVGPRVPVERLPRLLARVSHVQSAHQRLRRISWRIITHPAA